MPSYRVVKRQALCTIFIALFTLSACASSSSVATRTKIATPTATAMSTSTATPGGPQPTPFVPNPGDTSVCNVITPAEFAQVADASATEITSGTTNDSLTGLLEVYCIYDDASDPHQFIARGTLNYEFASDATSAASIFARVKQTFGGVIDVPGVGDDAFSGTPGGTPEGSGYGLLVLHGRLLLYLSVAGTQQMVVDVTKALATLALSRVA